MERDLKGDFETRLAEVSPLAYRVAFSVLRNSEDAEDVAQESFAKAYRNFRQLKDRNRFGPWLVRMTWRMAIDRLRSDRRRTAREVTTADLSKLPTPVQMIMQRERSEKLWHAIDDLPAKFRIVIVLAGIEENDIRQVAALLQLPEGTIKSRLFRARRRLKELLG